jgi:anti-sigma regulatory factor (Ser/Thr protein kinase)
MRATVREVRLELERHPTAGRAARRAIDDDLDGLLDAELRAALRTVISELVNNAVQHGGDGPIAVEIEVAPRAVRAEVRDCGNGFDPNAPRGRGDGNGGLGLLIVDRETTRWGVSSEDGTRVWVELSRPRRGA